MFFQRRRLQVLVSLLVIVVASLYLAGEIQRNSRPSEPALASEVSQLAEAYFLLRHNYVHEVRDESLLQGAVDALEREARARHLHVDKLSPIVFGQQSGEVGLRRVEAYLERVAELDRDVLPPEQAVYVALSGMTGTLNDPYTAAMDPATFARFHSGIDGRLYGGVGMEIEWAGGAFVVFEVSPGSPAALAGILPGDHLLGVGDRDLREAGSRGTPSLEDVRSYLAGEVSSVVTLRLERGGAAYSRLLTRAIFRSRSVHGSLVGDATADEPVLGWLKVQTLAETTGHEMTETLAHLRERGAVGFVIDLRDNVGGYLNAAVEVASMFLPSGQLVVTIEGRAGKKSKYTIGAQPIESPLMVLVNQRTASSAEILAAALQDYGRAVLVGEKTFGKGSVQTLHDFADGGGFKMTTARYLTPRERVLEARGLTPDVEMDVSMSRDEEALRQDVLSYCRLQWTTTKRSKD